MLRAHPNLVFIHKYLKDTNKRIFFASATVGQWLGDWRPNRITEIVIAPFLNKVGELYLS